MESHSGEKSLIREGVRKFYDTYGWTIDRGRGQYQNDLLYGDLSDIAKEYDRSCEARYAKHFVAGGRFFLDVGCGAKPIKQLGQKFQRHVCVDISLVGLTEARQKLGDRGLYVVADMSALPFKDDVFDGVVASYCLYHLDKDSQLSAVREFYRVVKAKKNIVVFYVAKNSLVLAAHTVAKAVAKISCLLTRLFRSRKPGRGEAVPFVYLCVQSPFQLSRGFGCVDITCLRSLTRVESLVLHELGLLGPATRCFLFLERKFPHAMLLLGSHAAVRIQKTTEAVRSETSPPVSRLA
jgi:ubiquinone/menaquinone biosynthesis C-methylase UbiE